MPMKTFVREVTPELATKWLEGNTHNRPIRDRIVAKYAARMLAGKWRLTHQGIAFNDEEPPRLIDGQHRLWAVINSKTAVEMMVTMGLPMSVQVAVDDHTKRTALDTIMLQKGMRDATARHISAARIMLTLGIGKEGSLLTNEEVSEFCRKFYEGIDFILSEPLRGSKSRGVTSAPVVATMAQAYYCNASRERLIQFGAILLDRAKKVEERDCGAMLLKRYLNNLPVGQSGSQVIMYKKAQNALYKFLQGDVFDTLYEAKQQLFPLPGTQRPVAKLARAAARPKES